MPGINVDGGAVDMYTEPTMTAMDRLSRIGTTFQAAWAPAMQRVDASRAMVGKGQMGEAFAAAVDAPAASLREQIDGEAGPDKVSKEYSDVGKQAVRDYLDADANGRDAMPG